MITPLRLRALAFVPLLAAAAIIAGCAKPQPAAVKSGPPDVLVETPTVRPVTDYEDFTGRTEGYKVVEVRPEVTGKLRHINFRDGDFVTAGDPLFEIDDVLFKAAVKKAEADVEKAKADISNWKAQILLAKAELRRAEKAAESSAAAQTDVDKARATLDVNTAQLSASMAAKDAAEAALDTARIQLGYTTIFASHSGRIGRRLVDEGNILKANETLLTRLIVLDPIYITFDIDERTVLMFRKLIAAGKIASSRDRKLEVLVGLADEEGYSFHATLTFADNQLDLNTGTLRFRAEMPNLPLQFGPLPAIVGSPAAVGAEQKGLRLLSPGMFVRVRLPVGKEHPGVLIPEEALGSDQGQRFVYVVNEKDEAIYRRVKLGPQEGKYRVIDEGLSTNERVIVSGLQRVRANAKVNPKPAGVPAKKKE
jgi:multidrug efflux system membrane fusion protein